jgi:hypothetical protein
MQMHKMAWFRPGLVCVLTAFAACLLWDAHGAEAAVLSINGTVRPMLVDEGGAEYFPRVTDVSISCGFSRYSSYHFSLELFVCPYVDSADGCRSSWQDARKFCLLYNGMAHRDGPTSCECPDLACHRLYVTGSVKEGQVTLRLPQPLCRFAGQYVCRTEEYTMQVEEANASLEMLPGDVVLTHRVEGSDTQAGSVLEVTCQTRTTLDVTFVWIYSNSGRGGWRQVELDKVDVTSHWLNPAQRCFRPWESRMTRTLDVTDSGRRYRCIAVCVYQQRVVRLASRNIVYLIKRISAEQPAHVTSAPGTNTTERTSAKPDSSAARTPGLSRQFAQVEGRDSDDDREATPADTNSDTPLPGLKQNTLLLMVSGILGGLLIVFTLVLVLQSNVIHTDSIRRLFRRGNSAPAAPAAPVPRPQPQPERDSELAETFVGWLSDRSQTRRGRSGRRGRFWRQSGGDVARDRIDSGNGPFASLALGLNGDMEDSQSQSTSQASTAVTQQDRGVNSPRPSSRIVARRAGGPVLALVHSGLPFDLQTPSVSEGTLTPSRTLRVYTGRPPSVTSRQRGPMRLLRRALASIVTVNTARATQRRQNSLDGPDMVLPFSEEELSFLADHHVFTPLSMQGQDARLLQLRGAQDSRSHHSLVVEDCCGAEEDDVTSRRGLDDATSRRGVDDATSRRGVDDATSRRGLDDASGQEHETAF